MKNDDILVLAWMKHSPLNVKPALMACVYSRDIADRKDGLHYAEDNNYCLFELPDSDDVLTIAREKLKDLYRSALS